MSCMNNNITISGKYKLLWHAQSDSLSNYKLFMRKLGMNENLVWLNMDNTHVQVEDNMQDTVVLKFGKAWDALQISEVV